MRGASIYAGKCPGTIYRMITAYLDTIIEKETERFKTTKANIFFYGKLLSERLVKNFTQEYMFEKNL